MTVASSHADGEPLRAIGVDPVDECLAPLEQIVCKMASGAKVSLVCGAIGESSDSIEVVCVPRIARLTAWKELQEKKGELLDKTRCRHEHVVFRKHVNG